MRSAGRGALAGGGGARRGDKGDRPAAGRTGSRRAAARDVVAASSSRRPQESATPAGRVGRVVLGALGRVLPDAHGEQLSYASTQHRAPRARRACARRVGLGWGCGASSHCRPPHPSQRTLAHVSHLTCARRRPACSGSRSRRSSTPWRCVHPRPGPRQRGRGGGSALTGPGSESARRWSAPRGAGELRRAGRLRAADLRGRNASPASLRRPIRQRRRQSSGAELPRDGDDGAPGGKAHGAPPRANEHICRATRLAQRPSSAAGGQSRWTSSSVAAAQK